MHRHTVDQPGCLLQSWHTDAGLVTPSTNCLSQLLLYIRIVLVFPLISYTAFVTTLCHYLLDNLFVCYIEPLGFDGNKIDSYSDSNSTQVANRRVWPESASEANWHHGSYTCSCIKQNRRPTTSFRAVPSGGNRDASHGRRVKHPPASCGERRKTCAAQSIS